ncbi:hypothetical protein KUTeg_024646 [Tegillarca granosa]|uniref:Uncharacterized protein n=1 Tax=Tegillarca granosa TaxID=220873 RepID=A0ABQ9DYZ0_TEGGR|nr:hypothetical protein KUTeg_024646 [Tegillarca granosa]
MLLSVVYKVLSLSWIFMCFLKTYLLGAYVLLKQLMFSRDVTTEQTLKTGMVAIVTGGDAGIGYEVSKGLVSKNVHVIIAGVMFKPYTTTEDGLEYHFQVNYLGHLYLTSLLLDKLKQSGADNSFSRIINVSSVVHVLGSMNIETLVRPSKCWGYSSHYAYAESKLAIVMSTYRLHHEFLLDKCPVTVNAIHPGVVNTDLYRYVHWSLKWLLDFLATLLYKTPEEGADGILYLALSSNLEGESGGYYDSNCKHNSSTVSYNEDLQNDLWLKSFKIIEDLTQQFEDV